MTTVRLDHHLRRMLARDPGERERSATPLELLFDLTFVVAFGFAANELAHYLAEGHFGAAIGGFAFAIFSVGWAWGSYSWFASAFDNDDWLFRIATLVQMVGVVVLALGVAPMFASLEAGGVLDNGLMVAGYVVMRVAQVALWLRVAVEDPEHRRAAIAYTVTIATAQLGWVALLMAELPIATGLLLTLPLFFIEITGPALAELRLGGTPWNPDHIAERHGLLVIITIGEVVLGTVTAISALVGEVGWSSDAILLLTSGMALAFGIWWIYFIVPSGIALRYARRRATAWGYAHQFLFAGIAAVGAGIHVAAYQIEGVTVLDDVQVLLTTAIPLFGVWVVVFAMYWLLMGEFDWFHIPLFLGATGAIVVAVIAMQLGASLAVGIGLLVLSALIIIVGYELVGWRHQERQLRQLIARSSMADPAAGA